MQRNAYLLKEGRKEGRRLLEVKDNTLRRGIAEPVNFRKTASWQQEEVETKSKTEQRKRESQEL